MVATLNGRPGVMHIALMGFLRWCKVDVKALGVEAPRLVKIDAGPSTRRKNWPHSSLRSRRREHKALFNVLLKCGLPYARGDAPWSGLRVDYRHRLLHVRAKKHWNFMLKDFEERSVPLANDVAALLTALHRVAAKEPF